MRARATLFIVFLAGILVFATFSPAIAAQASSEQQQREYQQNQQNSPGNNSNFSDDLSNTMDPQRRSTTPNQAVTPGAAPNQMPPGNVQPGVETTPTGV